MRMVLILLSLSARRAWIEIVEFRLFASSGVVALRKESVDRNDTVQVVIIVVNASLSARRAWIEMRMARRQRRVASCRSPQGERG